MTTMRRFRLLAWFARRLGFKVPTGTMNVMLIARPGLSSTRFEAWFHTDDDGPGYGRCHEEPLKESKRL